MTRNEAKRLALKTFNNKPCKHGHISDNWTSSGRCITCDTNYHKNNKEKSACRVRRSYKNNKHTRKKEVYYRIHLKRMYGLTYEQYEEILIKQEYRCAICKIHQNELKYKLAVDHNHKTGKIRGLLCSRCNKGIGFLYDNPIILEQAITYLKQH